ncbi:hypothetical protein CVT24_005957 [Panaeolus cyanescens]|uniref:Zn(2)-C6 fungal-type domain-containing protein n=1 Tax=Panaeolus cyanescens TaxID=181874 RepID=A0A409YE59_9AGAR|nr:hypothetical protein CVT24_005957 [Panaeolus cyanescens]
MPSNPPPLSSMKTKIHRISRYLTMMAEEPQERTAMWPALYDLLKLVLTPVVRNAEYKSQHQAELAQWPLNIAYQIFATYCKTKKIPDSIWPQVLQASGGPASDPSRATSPRPFPPRSSSSTIPAAPTRPQTSSSQLRDKPPGETEQDDGGSASGKRKRRSTGSTVPDTSPRNVVKEKRVEKKARTVHEDEEEVGMQVDDNAEGSSPGEEDEVEVVGKKGKAKDKPDPMDVDIEEEEATTTKPIDVDSSSSSEEVAPTKPKPQPSSKPKPKPKPTAMKKSAKSSGEAEREQKSSRDKGKGKAVEQPPDSSSGSESEYVPPAASSGQIRRPRYVEVSTENDSDSENSQGEGTSTSRKHSKKPVSESETPRERVPDHLLPPGAHYPPQPESARFLYTEYASLDKNTPSCDQCVLMKVDCYLPYNYQQLMKENKLKSCYHCKVRHSRCSLPRTKPSAGGAPRKRKSKKGDKAEAANSEAEIPAAKKEPAPKRPKATGTKRPTAASLIEGLSAELQSVKDRLATAENRISKLVKEIEFLRGGMQIKDQTRDDTIKELISIYKRITDDNINTIAIQLDRMAMALYETRHALTTSNRMTQHVWCNTVALAMQGLHGALSEPPTRWTGPFMETVIKPVKLKRFDGTLLPTSPLPTSPPVFNTFAMMVDEQGAWMRALHKPVTQYLTMAPVLHELWTQSPLRSPPPAHSVPQIPETLPGPGFSAAAFQAVGSNTDTQGAATQSTTPAPRPATTPAAQSTSAPPRPPTASAAAQSTSAPRPPTAPAVAQSTTPAPRPPTTPAAATQSTSAPRPPSTPAAAQSTTPAPRPRNTPAAAQSTTSAPRPPTTPAAATQSTTADPGTPSKQAAGSGSMGAVPSISTHVPKVQQSGSSNHSSPLSSVRTTPGSSPTKTKTGGQSLSTQVAPPTTARQPVEDEEQDDQDVVMRDPPRRATGRQNKKRSGR